MRVPSSTTSISQSEGREIKQSIWGVLKIYSMAPTALQSPNFSAAEPSAAMVGACCSERCHWKDPIGAGALERNRSWNLYVVPSTRVPLPFEGRIGGRQWIVEALTELELLTARICRRHHGENWPKLPQIRLCIFESPQGWFLARQFLHLQQ